MSRLNKKLLRDLVTHWAQVGAIIAVVALGIIMFSGPLLATRDLKDSVNDIYRRTRYEDFSASMDQAPATATGQVASLPNVTAAEGRLIRETQGRVLGHRLTVRVISVPDVGRPTVNGVILENGGYLPAGALGFCMVEHHLASEFNLKPGLPLTVVGPTGEMTFSISASVVSPEYLRLVRSRAEYVTDPAQFGVIFVRYSDAASLFGAAGRVDNIAARVANQKKLQVTMAGAEKALAPYQVTSLTTGADEPDAQTLSLELRDISRIALFFSLLLLAVASLAVYITMTQIVYSQQREIGVTRAIGYRRHTISEHYVGYGIVLGLSGGVLGVVIGYFLSGIYAHIYANVFDLPLIKTSIYAGIILAGVGVGLAFTIVGALVPARHAIRMKPADAMRTEAGLSVRRSSPASPG